MSATIHSLPRHPASQPAATHSLCSATVTGCADGHFLLDDAGLGQAQLAASCLLEPAVGDTVLLTYTGQDEPSFILAVLQRAASTTPAHLQLPGGNQLTSDSSGVRIQASSLSLNANTQLELNSAQLNVNAIDSSMTVKHWQGCFDTAESHAVNVKFTAKTLTSSIGRLIQRLVESFRATEGTDETRAGRIRVRARDHHQIDAGHLTHTAQGFVKIDGQKIDLG